MVHVGLKEKFQGRESKKVRDLAMFGGRLTAFRYPEREIIDVKAYKVYYEPARPFLI